MDAQPRERLAEFVRVDNNGLVQDAQKVHNILQQACPEARPERAALVAAVEEGVALRISRSSDLLSTDGELTRLAADLERDRALTRAAAAWAVRSWAWILGIGPAPEEDRSYEAEVSSWASEPTLSALPRERLAEFVSAQPGQTIQDARRVKGFLQDVCPSHRRELSLLVAAVEEGVPLTAEPLGRVAVGG
ncbi:MAG: hypothetical protein ACRDZO_26645 [Egibacteraceae bacterium]